MAEDLDLDDLPTDEVARPEVVSDVPEADVVRLEAFEVAGLALAHARLPLIEHLTVRNPTGTAWNDVLVRVEAEPAFAEPWTARLTRLEPYRGHRLDPRLSMSPMFLAEQTERQSARLIVTVTVGEDQVARRVHDLRVAPPTHWFGATVLPELLAGWVRPNSPALPAVLRKAADRAEALTGDRALCGYQKADPQHAWRLAQAGWEALQQSGVDYIDPPASFERVGQKVRTPTQVLEDGFGTCIDLAVVLAALWEQMGLNPFVVVIEGHAFAGIWLTPYVLPQPVLHDDPRPLRKRIDLGEALVVDSSPVAGTTPFDQARRAAEAMLDDLDRFVCLVDIAACRAFGVTPMPGDGEVRLARAEGPRERDLADVVDTLPQRWLDDDMPDGGSGDRIDRWKSRLLDLSLRNRLLNFRLGSSAASLPFCDLASMEDVLAGGDSLELLPRPPVRITEGVTDEERSRLRFEALRDVGLELQQQGRVIVDLPPAEHGTTLLKLYRASRTAFQESGATTLYLTLGALAWYESDSSDKRRLAPLVLVPVELVRPAAQGNWSLKAADEEARVNVTLLEKLKADFGVQTDGLGDLPKDAQGVDVPKILARFRRLVKPFDRWEVFDEAWLGQFSFTKFLMWLDLEAKRDALAKNPVAAQLFAGAASKEGPAASLPQVPLVDEDKLDHERPTADTITVMDADPSQLQAILAACDGASFVLQGPPGTGKSQSITNMIAQLLGQGKTVLFVSEKLAALDVVQRRLERVGLGPFCLELHAHQGSKRMVAAQIERAFEYANQQSPADWQARVEALGRAREALNAHAATLASPSPFGVCLRDVLASMFSFRDLPGLALPDVDPATLGVEDVEAARRAAHHAAVALPDAGDVAGHPWRGVRTSEWTPSWQRDVVDAVRGLREATHRLRDTVGAVAEALQWPTDGGVDGEELDALAAAVRVVRATPGVPRALLAEPAARDRIAQLCGWVDRGAEIAGARETLRARWKDDLLGLDLESLHRRHEAWGDRWLVRVFTLWTARSALSPVARDGLPDEDVITPDLVLAMAVRAGLAEIDSWNDAARWLGRHWAGVETDWNQASGVVAWTERATAVLLERMARQDGTHGRILDLCSDQADLVRDGGPLRRPLDAFQGSRDAWEAARSRLVSVASLDLVDALGPAPSLTAVADWCDRALGSEDRLRAWCAVTVAFGELRSLRLGPVVDGLLDGSVDAGAVERAVEGSLRTRWWEHRVDTDRDLARFRGTAHADLVERFRTLDEEVLQLSRQHVVATVASRVPKLGGPGDELALLRRELMRQRGHLPVRTLFERIGSVLERVKPCVLMSPLSVAQFLDPSLSPFDVVVFDEASQIPPWDAVGAIARGRQAIIVGDSKQLPPTSFFSRGADDEVDETDLVEMESVLDEAEASGMPSLRLRWHYRSRHESLITFSNHHYYDNRLHTFPSADHAMQGVGVSFHHVADGFYDRGGARTNQREAEEVVAEVIRLLRLADGERPTIGVVTFSMAQRDLILDLVEAAQQDHPELAPYFADGSDEPVFIKNLENVQGDERDVMLFSIGYGPDQTGRVTMNFGPLNREGGERRLNVAVTRARKRLVVYSTLRHDQIRVAGTSSLGVRHLKTFLHYAEAGQVALDTVVDARSKLEFESPFEEEVHAFLTSHGYQVDTQIGSSGYRIDLGVVHPDRPGAYAVAVECDGATYHGSQNARERDRLRDAVLEGLGWRIIRVWSTDWWYESEMARSRLLAAVEEAIRTFDDARVPVARMEPPPQPTPSQGLVDVKAALEAGPTRPPLPKDCTPWSVLPAVRGGPKDEFHHDRHLPSLARDLMLIVRDVGPITRDDAYRHVAQAWGWSGLGKRVVGRLDEALTHLGTTMRPVLRDEVLWPVDKREGDWTAFRPAREGGPSRDADSLPVAEVANAAVWVVGAGVSMSREAAMKELADLFGYGRMGRKVAARLDKGIDRAVASGRIKEDEGKLTVG